MVFESRNHHVRSGGLLVVLSSLVCHRAAGFVSFPPSAAVGTVRGFYERSTPRLRFEHQQQQDQQPKGLSLRNGHHHHLHHRRPLLLRAAAAAAFAGSSTRPARGRHSSNNNGGSSSSSSSRNSNSNSNSIGYGNNCLGDFSCSSTVRGRLSSRLAATAAAAGSSTPFEPEEDSDGSDGDDGDAFSRQPPPAAAAGSPPLSAAAAAAAVAAALAASSPPPEAATTDRDSGNVTAAARAIASAPGAGGGSERAAAMAVGGGEEAAVAGEEKGPGGKKMVVERERKHATGPPTWAPRWAVEMHPVWQGVASIGLYFFHMLHLSKSGLTFPFQLIPNNYGLFQSVGLDTAAGFAILGVAGWSRVRSGLPLFPPLGNGRGVTGKQNGNLKGGGGGGGGGGVKEGGSKTSLKVPWKLEGARVKAKLPLTFAVLIIAYLLSGLGSTASDYLLYGLSYLGVGMSVAMHRSLQVLMSHLVWVYMGVKILSLAVKSFFDREKGSWIGMKWKSNWLWWVIGGYFVSSSLFNMADLANQFLCPLPPDAESVVVKIINPENNDVAAMAVGSIAPCISAPWWEEVLYRGFLLPALTLYLPLKAALPAGSFLFAAHHMNLQAMLPLSVLGLVWSLLYVYSGNLLVTVLIHAMWNSRVFLGSLLGL